MWYNISATTSKTPLVLQAPRGFLITGKDKFPMTISECTTKRCARCKESYPATAEYFNKDRHSQDGLYVRCRRCHNAKLVHEVLPNGIRRCTECKQILDYSEFYKDARSSDGLYSCCKSCFLKRSKHSYENHVDVIREKARTRARLEKDQRRPRRREYSKANADKIHEYSLKYYNDPDNREKRKVNVQRRLARKRNLPDTYTGQDWLDCLNCFGHCCAACGRPRGLWHSLAMDHWIPLTDPRSDNPGTVPWNIIPLCHGIDGCNNSKAARDPIEWLTDKFGSVKAKRISAKIQSYLDIVKDTQR
jgi:hypothetical protein